MIIRERATVIQLYRAVYDSESKRSKTQYLGALPKFGEPTTVLLAKLTDSERKQLADFLTARNAAHDAIHGRYQFADTPSLLLRVAAWLRGQQKTPEIRDGAKAIRDAYADLYAVMRSLGISRLRAGSARRATRCGETSTPAGEAAVGADAVTPALAQNPAIPGEA